MVIFHCYVSSPEGNILSGAWLNFNPNPLWKCGWAQYIPCLSVNYPSNRWLNNPSEKKHTSIGITPLWLIGLTVKYPTLHWLHWFNRFNHHYTSTAHDYSDNLIFQNKYKTFQKIKVTHEKNAMIITGWWFQPTPLKNHGVRQWEGWHPIYDGKYNSCSKPPTS